VTDQTGAKRQDIFYTPFGVVMASTGDVSVSHTYTSQEFDPETGLMYYNARHYNPVLGRFISADTIVPGPADPQALNRYSYVNNNPLYYTDPSGHGLRKWYRAFRKDHTDTRYRWSVRLGIVVAAIGVWKDPSGTVASIGGWMMNYGYNRLDRGGYGDGGTVTFCVYNCGGGSSGQGGSSGGGGIHEPVYNTGSGGSNSGGAYTGLTQAELDFVYQYTMNLLSGSAASGGQNIGLIFMNGNVFSNPAVLFALQELSAALAYPAYIVVSGGDRYRDKYGNIRSSSNDRIVKGSAPDTTHLSKLAADFYVREFNLEVQRLRPRPPMAFYSRGTSSVGC
jgi:RHS repeat-associated protein